MSYEAITERKEKVAQKILSLPLEKDLYGDAAVFRIIRNVDTEAACKQLQFTADWFEHPHPNGRDLRGESDFTSIRLINALYQCYDRLPESIRFSLKRFFLQRDYSSIYGSENHALMYHVSRYLAAQFYPDCRFEQYDLSAAEIMQEDAAYLSEFLMYRARRAWGEFDSLGYAAEIMLILETLYLYCRDEKLKKFAAMSMDMILLDMVIDCKDGKYAGAHGRIYEQAALNAAKSGMYAHYCFFFGAEADLPEVLPSYTAIALSDYHPREIVYQLAKNRTYPYENRERKHLHCCEAWTCGIHPRYLDAVEGLSIEKYLYLCDEYALGGIVHQDNYPTEIESGWYAHHQQHEWELTFPGDPRTKIFSHHPGDSADQHQHNYWTGDLHCCCGTHFCTKDTALSLYHIQNPKEYDFVHADIPVALFDEVLYTKQAVFLRHGKTDVMMWFSEGYEAVTEGENAGFDFISHGRKHAVVCHVESAEKYASLQDFADQMAQEPIVFDKEQMSVRFREIEMDYSGHRVNGVSDTYPNPMLYDSPYLRSVYGSGILEVTVGNAHETYDFNI